MERLIRWRFESFVVALSVAAASSGMLSTARVERESAFVSAVGLLVLLGHRRVPLLVSVLSFVLLGVALSINPTASGAQFFALLAVFAIVGAINKTRDGIISWALGAAILAYGAFVAPGGGGSADALLSVAFASCMWVAGRLVSRHHQHALAMESLARRVEQTHEERTRDALAAERATIARELHDVVSHGLSVIVVQALAARGALEDLAPPRSADVERHLDAVEATARDALGEMRRMLGLLQIEDIENGPAPEAPTPGLRHLSTLVERGRSAGLDIDATLPVAGDLAAGLELSVYRLAQEALTNVVKHAPGAHVDLRIQLTRDRVVVHVRDTGGIAAAAVRPGQGYGLIGMRERVAVYGGVLHAGSVPGGGFDVRATFPREDGVPTGPPPPVLTSADGA